MTGRLTDRDRDIIARARKLAATATTDDLRQLAGADPGFDGDTIRSEALGVARYLLDELADLAGRLAAGEDLGDGAGDVDRREPPVSAAGMDGAAAGLEELAGLINFRVGAWQDFGYAEPPTPDCATIPPLGKRSAKAIEAGHEAIKDIDQLLARLHQVRAQLVSELRQDEDIRAARVDAMLAERRDGAG